MTAHLTDPEQLKELLGIPFTPEQTACITAPPAPQVIVAGAGSGKTTVMAARVVWLVGTGQVAPEQVLGLTFTNKAAGELAERVRRALVAAGVTDPDPASPGNSDDIPGEPEISTYHAFAGRLLKDHGLRIGLEPTTRLLADATRFQLAAKVLREATGPYPALTKSLPGLVEDLLALDGELAEHLVPPERLRAHDTALLRALETVKLGNADLRKVPEAARARLELLGLTAAYREQKRRHDLIDFGDQIALSAALARAHPEVGRQLREEFAVVLLDEYQDTSVAQRLLLASLFGDGTGHAVTAVGDPCQAIYGWRGASVANLDDFPEHFPFADGSPARRFALSENRRSGGRLLDLANRLAAPLRARHAGVEALRPAPGAERDGIVRCALLTTHAEELAWLADSVAHLVRTGTPPGEIAVLCRTAGDFARIQGALVERDVPVEVVGLSGLLHLPEIADLVAVCEVLQDPTANASLVRLLSGPRWRIGPRDLALLGRRARALVAPRTAGPQPDDDVDRRLAEAVEGVDPAEVVSLADALDTFLAPDGDEEADALPFSAAARVRFARLAAELRDLRRSLGDPLMDVLHRVLAVTGLEVELSASPHALAARRRETLGGFLDIAASFASLDGEATLLAFLGFLRTAAQYEKGLDHALPGTGDTVKVLTAHKSKGLEWDVVAVPGLVAGQFPSERARESWTANAKVLPHALRGDAATLPDTEDWTSRGMSAFKTAMKEHQGTEELRLGYVTFTRPRSLLLGSGHWWGPEQKKPRGPSVFLDALREHCEAGHGEVEAWADAPPPGEENPAFAKSTEEGIWPLPLDPEALSLRRRAARAVLDRLDRAPAGPRDADIAHGTHGPHPTGSGDAVGGSDPGRAGSGASNRDLAPGFAVPHPSDAPPAGAAPSRAPRLPAPRGPGRPPGEDTTLTPEEARAVASWDRDLDALAGELRRARATVRDVPVPAALSASQLMRLASDPEGFARELARPMPRPPQPAARRGTRFHAWVESRFEEVPLLGPEELPDLFPDEPGAQITDERDLEELKRAFERTPYARRNPHRVEWPFSLTLAGRVIRGRVDAVYRGRDADDAAADHGPGGPAGWEIVDWKTNRAHDADPLQLAVYRLAWAEAHGLPLSDVTASFLYVRSGEVVRPDGLPDRTGLERILLGGTGAPGDNPGDPGTPGPGSGSGGSGGFGESDD
ncbi:UvrD-helicase domain-containing protein [Streptomyces meridianus]|uniref:DNA 3'-5' helicase n=1 Tax=Streptomyces meridianus TaxID=2938945 RepID=A0ABT0X0S3_9ACTN|nr:ATP-dependent DNA helicase [Streptomyces meridianus]MCM2576162.1 ATP-dependent helicase [Streptomyces meridianus]